MPVNWNDTEEAYKAIVEEAFELMKRKNSDYGESWKVMRRTSITDQIRVKLLRIVQIEELEKVGLEPEVSEGKDSELRDIINYAVFHLIKAKQELDQPWVDGEI